MSCLYYVCNLPDSPAASTSNASALPTVTPAPSDVPVVIATSNPVTSAGRNWIAEFVIPFDSLSAQLRSSLQKKVRLVPKLRRELVRKLTDAIVVSCNRPRKQDLDQIAMQVVSEYPESLMDVIDGVVIGSGHSSLTTQLVSRVENINRSTGFSSIRRKRSNAADTGDNQSKQLRAIDAYGCVNWQPDLPDGETEDSQKSHKEALKNMHDRGQCDSDTVTKLSTLAYYLQRRDINSNQTVVNLMEGWPFLFTEAQFRIHVNELVGFDVHSRIQTAVQDKGLRLISFFRSVQLVQVNQVLQQLDSMSEDARRRNGQLPVILPALMSYMKEDLSILCIGTKVGISSSQHCHGNGKIGVVLKSCLKL
jgi:hypothetical protein